MAADATSNPYVKPTILDEGSGLLELKQARHPILERLGVDFIPNDLKLDRKEENFKIITGPNLGKRLISYIKNINFNNMDLIYF